MLIERDERTEHPASAHQSCWSWPSAQASRPSRELPELLAPSRSYTEGLEASRFKEILSTLSLRYQAEPVIKMVHPTTGNVW